MYKKLYLNLFNTQEEAYQTQKQLKKLQQRVLKSNRNQPGSESLKMRAEKPTVSPPEGDADVWLNQIPFEIPVMFFYIQVFFVPYVYLIKNIC